MTDLSIQILIFVAALGCGLAAGVFFAFSTFVMPALARLAPEQGIAAMQAINVTAVTPAFMSLLFGTALICLLLAVATLFGLSPAANRLALIAGVIYLVGVIGVTIVGNVPLNDELAATQPNAPTAVTIWAHYLANWTMLNHVRAVAPIVSTVLFMLALL